MADKLYYSVFTINEKIWVYADFCDVKEGCLVFYDVDEDGTNIPITAFQQGYWIYCYEADPESGESIQAQIPFWKRHERQVPTHARDYRENREFKPKPPRSE